MRSFKTNDVAYKMYNIFIVIFFLRDRNFRRVIATFYKLIDSFQCTFSHYKKLKRLLQKPGVQVRSHNMCQIKKNFIEIHISDCF